MARYKVLERSCIDGVIFEAGEECQYEGEVSGNLELIEDVKKSSKATKDDPAAEPAV